MFLGVCIDSGLTWTGHIENVIAKINKSFYAILKLKNCLDREGLLQIYYATVYPQLAYNTIVWGRAAEVNRLFIMQKRVIRLIFNIESRGTCRDVFRSYGILTLPCIYLYKCAIFAYQNGHLFPTNAQNHTYATRNCDSFRMPLHRTSGYERSPYYACISVYNRLPKQIKDSKVIHNFKSRLKQYLANECFYSVKEYLT